eukprot:scaffold26037_cov73-Phaeocystis_antarctica.AAC.3
MRTLLASGINTVRGDKEGAAAGWMHAVLELATLHSGSRSGIGIAAQQQVGLLVIEFAGALCDALKERV